MATVFEVIIDDHNRIRSQLSHLIDLMPSQLEQLENETNQVVVEIRNHLRAEEQVFYEALKEKDQDDSVREIYLLENEHEDIEDILEELYRPSEVEGYFRMQLLNLHQSLERHWALEETQTLPFAMGLLSPREAKLFGDLMLELKAEHLDEIKDEVYGHHINFQQKAESRNSLAPSS